MSDKLKQYGDRAMALDSDGKVMQKVAAQLTGSNVIQPVDVQARYSETIMTHNAVSVGAGLWSLGSWIDVSGYDEVCVNMLNDAATNHQIDIQYSHDASTIHGIERSVSSGTDANTIKSTSIKARYLKVCLKNGDAVAHTMSAWIYLKC